MKSKRCSFRYIFLQYLIVLLLTIVNVYAQRDFSRNPLYGHDSISRITCASNLSTMSEFYKINMFDYAYEAWRSCFNNCPQSSKNIYIMGARIIKHKIENASDEAEKQKLIDTLMLLYDKRIEYFNQEGYVLGRKGIDLLRYRPEETEEAWKYLNKSADLEKQNAEEAVLVSLMQATNILFKNGKRDSDVMISTYMKVSDYLMQSTSTDSANLKLAIEGVEKIFAESGAADCSVLNDIFASKYEANPDNISLLKRITWVLDKKGCYQSPLFAKAAESLFKAEPSADAAFSLAKLFESLNNFSKASYYYSQAVELETDNKTKANYYYRWSVSAEQQGDHQLSRNNALKAVELNPSSGEPYLIIGLSYAASSNSCGSNDFEKAAVFWAAVDMFIKAKNVDSGLTEKANEYIAKYSAYFPTKEEAFFNGYTNGMTYNVGCWINEKTTVRTR